jgi:hypothetical protein
MGRTLPLRHAHCMIYYDPFNIASEQVLRRQHAALFHLLGKTSARDVDKLQLIQDAGFTLDTHYGLATLSGDQQTCAASFSAQKLQCPPSR